MKVQPSPGYVTGAISHVHRRDQLRRRVICHRRSVIHFLQASISSMQEAVRFHCVAIRGTWARIPIARGPAKKFAENLTGKLRQRQTLVDNCRVTLGRREMYRSPTDLS